MKQLEELEKRISSILEANTKLRADVQAHFSEEKTLRDANSKLEEAILKEHGSVDELTKEKDAIKIAIEALLKNIDKLEELKDWSIWTRRKTYNY